MTKSGAKYIFSAVLIASIAVPAVGADLTKIERKIAKEPAYKSKTVKYGLLVFGLEAKTRVWFVIDGDTLYLDRNGNGDLTEEGKRIASDKEKSRPKENEYVFKIEEIRAGDLVHKNFRISYQPDFQRQPFYISGEIELPGWKSRRESCRVQQGVYGNAVPLQLGDSPLNAPIMHFGGPWELSPEVNHMNYDARGVHLLKGSKTELVVTLSTPGIGPGSTVRTAYDLVPENAYPIAEIIYPPDPNQPNVAPIRKRYELKDRC